MPKLTDLKIKLFTDGADKNQIFGASDYPWIAGFTTNPSLLKKAGSLRGLWPRSSPRADRHLLFEVFDDIRERRAA